MQQEILAKVEECFMIAEKFFGKNFERPRNIKFKRSGTTAGTSCYSERELMFQLDFADHNPENFISQVVPHEVAHYVQRAVYGYGTVKPHGKEWKFVMRRVYNLVPDRCHSYDTSVTTTRTRKRFDYSCGCTIHKISSIVHNRIQSGKKRYTCRSCGKGIAYLRFANLNVL
jgi:SprT protein